MLNFNASAVNFHRKTFYSFVITHFTGSNESHQNQLILRNPQWSNRFSLSLYAERVGIQGLHHSRQGLSQVRQLSVGTPRVLFPTLAHHWGQTTSQNNIWQEGCVDKVGQSEDLWVDVSPCLSHLPTPNTRPSLRWLYGKCNRREMLWDMLHATDKEQRDSK